MIEPLAIPVLEDKLARVRFKLQRTADLLSALIKQEHVLDEKLRQAKEAMPVTFEEAKDGTESDTENAGVAPQAGLDLRGSREVDSTDAAPPGFSGRY